jgi:hypothetical protein
LGKCNRPTAAVGSNHEFQTSTHTPVRRCDRCARSALRETGSCAGFVFLLRRFTRSLGFSFHATVFARFLLLCASSHAVSSYFDSVTVDGRKIGAEAILALILYIIYIYILATMPVRCNRENITCM